MSCAEILRVVCRPPKSWRCPGDGLRIKGAEFDKGPGEQDGAAIVMGAEGIVDDVVVHFGSGDRHVDDPEQLVASRKPQAFQGTQIEEGAEVDQAADGGVVAAIVQGREAISAQNTDASTL